MRQNLGLLCVFRKCIASLASKGIKLKGHRVILAESDRIQRRTWFCVPLQVQVEVVRELLCHPGTDVRPQFQGRVTRFIKIHFFRDIGSVIFCQLMGFASPRSRIYNKQGLSPAECFDPRWPWDWSRMLCASVPPYLLNLRCTIGQVQLSARQCRMCDCWHAASSRGVPWWHDLHKLLPSVFASGCQDRAGVNCWNEAGCWDGDQNRTAKHVARRHPVTMCRNNTADCWSKIVWPCWLFREMSRHLPECLRQSLISTSTPSVLIPASTEAAKNLFLEEEGFELEAGLDSDSCCRWMVALRQAHRRKWWSWPAADTRGFGLGGCGRVTRFPPALHLMLYPDLPVPPSPKTNIYIYTLSNYNIASPEAGPRTRYNHTFQ